MRQAFYLITGVMASGKSTVSQRLMERVPRGVHVRGDLFRRMVVAGQCGMSDTPDAEALRQYALRCDLAAHTARTYWEFGFSVALQDNYYGQALPDMLARLAGLPVRVVVLCPQPQEVARREHARPKAGYVSGFSVEALYHGFLASTPRIGLWLDTTHLTVEQTVLAIESHSWTP